MGYPIENHCGRSKRTAVTKRDGSRMEVETDSTLRLIYQLFEWSDANTE